MLIDLRVAQLLCSRVCHDLIGPVGAVNSGIELLGEEGGTLSDDAMALIVRSSAQASRRLAFYRIAFGLGGATGPRAVAEARDLAMALFDKGRAGLDWPAETTRCTEGMVGPEAVKLLLNLVLMAADCLPRGGGVAVRAAPMGEGVGIAVTAVGEGARLRDGIADVMAAEPPPGALSAHTVAAAFAQSLARALGTGIEISEHNGEVRFAALLPFAETES
ncbi:MAG: histidine phosphotransferase family protein [Rhodospirillales bacterium]|jgi:histidine phosphotransferase ChpT|nr:histidine phosphotransferase family protein [Rhodospirillales bacterium]